MHVVLTYGQISTSRSNSSPVFRTRGRFKPNLPDITVTHYQIHIVRHFKHHGFKGQGRGQLSCGGMLIEGSLSKTVQLVL